MNIGAIVLCRMDSQRLPGKPLRAVAGKPLLWYVLARCRQVAELSDSLVIATSSRPVDDPIVRYGEEHGIPVFRGSADNVAERVLRCAERFELEAFFRVNGDSPFVEPSLLVQACDLARCETYDFVTNLAPRSFPYGVSAELVATRVYNIAVRAMTSSDHREHVTKYLYDNLEQYRHFNIAHDGDDLSSICMTVDTPSDLQVFVDFVRAHGRDWPNVPFECGVRFYKDLIHEHA